MLERFPLKLIRDEGDYDRATAVLQDLIGREGLNDDQQDYIDCLVVLVRNYESERYKLDESQVSPLQALKHLMQANGMTVNDLAAIIGSQPYASMILSGERAISKENAKKLAGRFRVDAGLFL